MARFAKGVVIKGENLKVFYRAVFGELPDEDVYDERNSLRVGDKLNEKLSDDEADVIKYRYGFVDGKRHSLSDTEEFFGYTRHDIRSIESKAIRKLRLPNGLPSLFGLPEVDPLAELFSLRTYNALRRAGMFTIADIVDYDGDWMQVRNLNGKCYQEIEKKIHALGYKDFFIPMTA